MAMSCFWSIAEPQARAALCRLASLFCDDGVIVRRIFFSYRGLPWVTVGYRKGRLGPREGAGDEGSDCSRKRGANYEFARAELPGWSVAELKGEADGGAKGQTEE